MLSRVSRRVMATRHPNHREKYVALGDQDLAGFRSDLLRRRCAAENPLYPAALHKCRLWETWRALLWAPGAVSPSSRHQRSSCKRARSGMARGRGQPRSHSAEKRLLISHGRNTMAVREQSRSTGATGSAAELAGFMPP